MARQVLIVCTQGASSRYVAERLAEAFEGMELEEGEEPEEFDFNPRQVSSRPPSDDEIEAASVILTPFSEELFTRMSAGAPTPETDAWRAFFDAVKACGKQVIAYYDFEGKIAVEPAELAKRILATIK